MKQIADGVCRDKDGPDLRERCLELKTWDKLQKLGESFSFSCSRPVCKRSYITSLILIFHVLLIMCTFNRLLLCPFLLLFSQRSHLQRFLVKAPSVTYLHYMDSFHHITKIWIYCWIMRSSNYEKRLQNADLMVSDILLLLCNYFGCCNYISVWTSTGCQISDGWMGDQGFPK